MSREPAPCTNAPGTVHMLHWAKVLGRCHSLTVVVSPAGPRAAEDAAAAGVPGPTFREVVP